jgi:hypothetical protein
MTNRNTNNGTMNDTTVRQSNNGPLTAQRKSNDLVMTDGVRTHNSAPMNDAARVTNDGPMTTA